MKKFKKIIGLVLAAILVVTLASCSSDEDPNINGEIKNIVQLRDSLEMDVVLEDNSNLDDAILYLEISEKDDTDVLYTSNLASTTDLQNVSFSNLSSSTDYEVNLYATYNKSKYLVLNEEISTNDLGLEDNPIKITTIDELKSMTLDNTAYYSLENDLDFEGEELTPIFNQSTYFQGVFEGNNHSLKNFELNSINSYYSGIFGYIKAGTVKNLVISDASAEYTKSTYTYFGFLAGYVAGATVNGVYTRALIDNVTVSNSTINIEANSSNNVQIGLIIGTLRAGSDLVNSSASGEIIVEARYDVEAGGLVGSAGYENIKNNVRPEIDNCSSDVTINFSNNDYNFNDLFIKNNLGLAVGSLINANLSNVNSKGTITATSTKNAQQDYDNIQSYELNVGGLAGYVKNADVVTSVSSVVFNLTSADILDVNAGGLLGNIVDEFSTIKNSVVKSVTYNNNLTVDVDAINADITDEDLILVNNLNANLLVGYQPGFDFSDNDVLVSYVDLFNVYGLADAIYHPIDNTTDKSNVVSGISKDSVTDATGLNDECLDFLK